MPLEIKRLDSSLTDAFHALHHERHGCGLCQCVAWWVPTWEGWGERPPEQNRALREELFARGEYDGYLLFEDGEPVAWCQCGPRDRLEKLRRAFDLPPDPEAWALSCFLTAPGARGRGLARALLDGVLADLARRGVKRVEAFPRRGRQPDEDVWTGPESLFTAAGFTPWKDDPKRPVDVKTLF